MAQNEYLVDGADMTAVADAIRERSGTTAPLSFPEGMAEAVRNIQSGSGAVSSVNGRTGDVTLTAGDVGAVSVPATASVGQTIVVKAVDDSGKPTEWEAADRLPKSPIDWEAWTSDEQAAARDRMSAAKALSGNVVFDETITESVAAMEIPVPGGWNNILLRVLYPKAGAEYAGGVSTGDIFATAGKTNIPYQIYVYSNSIKTPTYNGRRVFFDFNLTKRGIYAELNRFFAGTTAQAYVFNFAVLNSLCAYSDVETIRFACSHIPAGTQFILYVD